MQLFLKDNISKQTALKKAMPSELYIPYNAGRRVGLKSLVNKTQGGFTTVPGPDRVSIKEWVADKVFTGEIPLFTKTDVMLKSVVNNPATSSTYAIKSKTIVHTTTAAATNTIAINVPVGARIIGANAIVAEDLVFAGGGVSADLTWTTSSENVAVLLADQNDKGSALFDQNAASAIVGPAVETMTLTPDAGTIGAGGVLVVTAWYEELTHLTDIA